MAAVKYTQTMSDADIVKGCASVKSRSESIRKHVDFLAVSILFQWARSGDASAMAMKAGILLNSVDASHVQKIVNYFGAYAGLELNEEKNGFTYTVTTMTPAKFQEAKAMSVFSFTPDKAPEAYDLRKAILALIERADAKRKKGLKAEDFAPEAMIEGLRSVLKGAEAPAAEAPATEEVAAAA